MPHQQPARIGVAQQGVGRPGQLLSMERNASTSVSLLTRSPRSSATASRAAVAAHLAAVCRHVRRQEECAAGAAAAPHPPGLHLLQPFLDAGREDAGCRHNGTQRLCSALQHACILVHVLQPAYQRAGSCKGMRIITCAAVVYDPAAM